MSPTLRTALLPAALAIVCLEAIHPLAAQECDRSAELVSDTISLNLFVDSLEVAGLVDAGWSEIGGFAFAHLMYDEQSRFGGAFVYGEEISERQAESLGKAISELVRQEVLSRAGIDLLLGTEAGRDVRALRELERCPPALRNETYLMQELQQTTFELNLAEEHRVLLWLHIDADGDVREARVVRSSGNQRVDDAGRNLMRRARYSPAMARGLEVDVFVTQWLSFGGG